MRHEFHVALECQLRRDHYTYRYYNAHIFSLATCAVLRHMTSFLLLSTSILWNINSTKQPDLYCFKTIRMTSHAMSAFTENRLGFLFFIQNLTRAVNSFLWFQNSMDLKKKQNRTAPRDCLVMSRKAFLIRSKYFWYPFFLKIYMKRNGFET